MEERLDLPLRPEARDPVPPELPRISLAPAPLRAECNRTRQVEPDDRVGSGERGIVELPAVRAVDHPAVGGDDRLDPAPELVGLDSRQPAW
jgi:hypothetical protein